MIRRDFIKGSAATVALAACPLVPFLAQAADGVTVYINGSIFTMNAKNDVVEALAVKGDKILKAGTKADVLAAAGANPKMIDLKGQALLPGFIDGHSHFPSGGYNSLYQTNLNVPPLGEVTDIATLKATLKVKAKDTKPGEWIIGYNYNDLVMKEGRHPTRADLDEVSMEHPILVRHVSGHLAAVNSVALKMAGVDETTPEPSGGKFRKDAQGKLDGVLEGPPAQAFVTKLLPKPTPDQYRKALAHESMVYAKAGVTTTQNGGSPTLDELFLESSANGTQKLRVVILPRGLDEKLVASYGDKRQGAVLDPNGKIILGALKFFSDGSPQGYTAYFSEPYFKQLPGKPADFRGFPVFKSRDELFAVVKKYHDQGWQIYIHTNGDQAIQDVMDAYINANQENPRKDHRHVLNHCQFTRPDQVPLIAKNGIIPSYFVTHTFFWGDIHREMVAGPERSAHISPLKSSLDNGIEFALHNDTPVTPINPIMSLFSAVNRLTQSNYVLGPDQRIGIMDALRGITINAARMHFLEDKLGSLEEGKLADLVILDQDPTKIDPMKLRDLKVQETIVGGETVYKS